MSYLSEIFRQIFVAFSVYMNFNRFTSFRFKFLLSIYCQNDFFSLKKNNLGNLKTTVTPKYYTSVI